MNFIFVDLEYNRLEFGKTKFKKSKYTEKPLMNELLQICIVVTNDRFKVLSDFNLYVKPTLTEKVSKSIAEKTKLDENKLKKIGKPLGTACDKLRMYLNKYNVSDSFVITWGTDDIRVIDENLMASGMSLENNLKNIDLQVVFANRNGFYDECNVMEHVSLINAGLMSGVSVPYDNAHNAMVDVDITIGVAKSIGSKFILDTKNQMPRKKAQNTMIAVGEYKIKYRPIVMGSTIRIKHKGDEWNTIALDDNYESKICEFVGDKEVASTMFLKIEGMRNINEENGVIK